MFLITSRFSLDRHSAWLHARQAKLSETEQKSTGRFLDKKAGAADIMQNRVNNYMLGLKKFFVPDPVDAKDWPPPERAAGVSATSAIVATAAVSAPEEHGWKHPDVVAAAEQGEASAPRTFVDWVDWNAVGAAVAEATEEAFEPQKEYEPPLGFTSFIYNHRTGKWDDGNDPNGIYGQIGYD